MKGFQCKNSYNHLIPLQMKCLRKTYLTYLNKALKGDAAKLSSHTTNAVLSKHYIDKRIIDSAVSEMTCL